MADLEEWFYRFNSWSYSKHQMWEQCRRMYYYRYIGTALRRSDDLDVSRLTMLKRLTPQYALQGQLIHEILENCIGQHAIGRGLNEEGAKRQYLQRVEQFRKTAQSTIIEFFHGFPDPGLFDRIRQDGLDNLDIFFGVVWPQLQDQEYIRHEKFDRCQVNGVEVTVKVDYVSKTKNGIIVITDWKTGKEQEDLNDPDLQVGGYVLWASDYFGVDPAGVRSELAYLKTGKMKLYEFDPGKLESIRKTITDDYREMNTSYEIGAFPADPVPGICKSCMFGSICPESQMSRCKNPDA